MTIPSLKTVTKDECRDTGMAIVLLLLLVYMSTRQIKLCSVAIVVQIINMIWPKIYAPAAVVWFGISRVLSLVVPQVFLSLIYFSVITPIGFVRRLLGKDSLKLRAFKSCKESVLWERNHLFAGRDMESPY